MRELVMVDDYGNEYDKDMLVKSQMDVYENSKFGVGAKVRKPKGYPYDGTVVSAFTTLAGEYRYVVESELAPGMLHIFSVNQIEVRT